VAKNIIFLSGTRADFGKIKSLINIVENNEEYEAHIFATGMHMASKYGKTINEIYKCGYKNIYPYINHDNIAHMDRNLAKTIEGFSHYIVELEPDLIVIHGDRIEALAGAIVGSLNNILVAHIEGGEVSGTIDELLRHSISKLSHIHLVANKSAKKRLIQMGEDNNSIFVIGSPDLDLMGSKDLPSLAFVKEHYQLMFDNYAILMHHPVTTEVEKLSEQIRSLVDYILTSNRNYVVIYPNNDLGSDIILKEYSRLRGLPRIKLFPSLRFEYFLVLLKNANFMIGNSSAGVREAPYYQVPTINIGNRQNNRVLSRTVFNCEFNVNELENTVDLALSLEKEPVDVDFGEGNSDELFASLISDGTFWKVDQQKQFKDI
jgi:UDP-N-acetylglucosamine 2-epimerase (hydrolysing)